MADSALGSVLSIPKSALDAIKMADERIQSIQNHSQQMGQAVNNAFTSMTADARMFSKSLEDIIIRLDAINSESKKMSGSFSNIGAESAAKQINKMGGAIIQAAQNIDRLINSQMSVNSMEQLAAKYAEIFAEKRKQAEEKVQQAKLKTQEEITKTAIAEEKAAATIVASESQKQKIQQQASRYQQEKARAQAESARAEQEEIKAKTAGINKSAEETRATIAETKATKEKIKALTEEVKVQTETAKHQTAQAKLSVEEARTKKAEAQAHLSNAQAIAKEARAKELIAKAQQSTNNANNRTTNFSDFKGVINQYANASSLREHAKAVKDLKQARLSLITTDNNYKQNLASVNAAIQHHSNVLKEAGVNARALTEQTSYMAGYMSRWAQRMAFAFSVGSVKNFVEQIASVRGQFELSERSLEAILQNKPKADEIFNKTVELAVKSPFRIKDLVDYTRQLSAYRIESDKLYDTTKRLADVSAGLGVDMGRLILAYGQVKAAAYLRGSEVRQFTEAGINMYGELQQYFKEVKGEAYTTAQIVDMISKRKVTFEDVEAIFQRMTDKGGTFYNMQEIQAKTLQGKISNLKDAFDVMLNDIGKANEGTMKGMVSWGTSMLDNWKALAEIGKALIPILIAIKANSMFAKTSLGQAFSQASGTGIVRYKALFVNSLDGMKKALKDFGGLVKSSLSGIGVGLAIYAVAEVITTVYDKISKYNENVRKAEEETIKAKGAIGALAGTYNDLANAATKANSKLGGKDLEKNIEDRRTTLQKLIDAASKDGLTFKINVDTLDVNQLNTTFSKVEKEYKDFIDSIEVIRRNYAKNDAWNTWFTDGLDDDAGDYKDAVIDALAKSSQMERVVANINANYKQATSTTKKYFDEIRAGQKDNESNIDYMTRMYELIKKINIAQGGSDYKMPSFIGTSQADFNDLIRAMNSVQNKAQELNSEFDAVFGNLRKKYSNDPIKIQGVIDRIAAERDWNQYERDLAYRHFGINVSINKNSMEKEVNWVDDYLSGFFAKKKYGINLVVKEITNDKALESFLEKGDDAAKAAKNWRELEKRLASVGKNTKKIKVDDSIRKMFKAGDPRLGGNTIDVSTLRQMVREYKNAATATAKGLGVNPFEKEDKKAAKNAAKEQRDILNERISLLKDMSSEYQKLIKYEGEEQATADVRKHFALAAKNVGMNINNFIPDRQTIAKKIEYLASQYKELGKRGSALRNATEIRLDIDEEYFKQQLDDAKNNAQEAFSQLDLFKKLKGEGLSDSIIKSMFGDLTSSFDDVRKSITDDFEAKWGKDQTKWGDDVAKEYTSQMQKLDKEVYQDQVNQAQELIKAYKTDLTERLQLDKWYYEEYMKIQNNANISKNKEMQEQMTENLKKQFRKKSADIDWKEFQNTDTYISIFENLDHTSTKALDYMIDRLGKMREQLKGLDPTQVKALTEQMEKLRQTRDARNPFKAFTTGLKEMTKANKDLKKLGGIKEWVSKNKQNDAEKDDIKASEDRVSQLEAEVKQSEILNGFEDERTKNLKLNLGFEKATLASKEAQNKKTQDSVNILNNAKDASDKAQNKFSKSVTDITSVVSTMATAFNGLFEALGGSDEQLENTLSVVDNIGQAIGSYYSGNYAGVAAGAMGALTGIAKLFSNEGKIDKEIARQERAINSLQHAYEKLKKSMDDAFDTQRLYEYNQKSVDALKKEQKAYQAMINAERGRKKPDEGKIQEWEQQIDDLNTTIQELGESMTEALGGFGSQSNYKSAAEAFSEVWVDAFNEGSDALEALNNKFDEYFNTMLTKQLMNRATSKYIQPILEAFDKAVSEGSEGGNNGLDVTKKELEGIKELKDKNLALFNEYAKNLMDVLNVKPAGSSNISALQQGIQSVTESTAQALESILNSLRYYVATQQADVRIIRDTLLEKLGNSISAITQDTSSSPVLIELRLQTTILTDIRDTLASCVKGGHKQGRNGIKVFMN